MRAIIYSWKTSFAHMGEGEVWPIIQKLSGELPCYSLPDAAVSRHRMPAHLDSALVTDTLVVVGDRPVVAVWRDVTLDESETAILGMMLGGIRYFGRAESRCAMRIIRDGSYNCAPLPEGRQAGADSVRVLAPRADVTFADACKGPGRVPLGAISVTTGALREENRADPPGGRYVQYSAPGNISLRESAGGARPSHLHDITIVRYAVAGRARLPVTDALRVGDMARTACMSRYGRMRDGNTSCTFAGKDASGRPLEGHLHASYLPTCETHGTTIDHLTVMAPAGFDRHELDVLFGLRHLYGRGLPRVSLVFQGCGARGDFESVPILQESSVWVSATPMVLARHAKHRGDGENRRLVDGPEEQIRRELASRYGDAYAPADVMVDGGPAAMHGTNVRPGDFHRWRSHGSVGDGRPYRVRLAFADPVRGPLSLGYASHYGLGMFVPERL